MICFAETVSIQVGPRIWRSKQLWSLVWESPSLDISILFLSRSISLRSNASHHCILYIKDAIRNGFQYLEAARGCAQAIPAASLVHWHISSFPAKYIIKSHGRHGAIHSHKVWKQTTVHALSPISNSKQKYPGIFYFPEVPNAIRPFFKDK